MWPGIMNMWNYWAPTLERGRLIGFAGSGSQVGIIIGFSLGGYLCVHGKKILFFYKFFKSFVL